MSSIPFGAVPFRTMWTPPGIFKCLFNISLWEKGLCYFSLEGSLSSKCCCSLHRPKPRTPLNSMTTVIPWYDTSLSQTKGTSSGCSKLLLVFLGHHSNFTLLQLKVKQATSLWTSCNLEFST